MRNRIWAICGLTSMICTASVQAGPTGAAEMLGELVRDYAAHDDLGDKPLIFGLQIEGEGGGQWTVDVDRNRKKKAVLRQGLPDGSTFMLKTDLVTLRKLYRGEISALTAAGRANMSDPAPLDLASIGGWRPSMDLLSDTIMPLCFHFFTRGRPEVVRFSKDHARNIHGGNAVAFYYQKGLRTAWYQLEKGMFINRDKKDATNPFPTLLIFTRGNGKARLDKKVMQVEDGMTVFVPAGMLHQIWTESTAGLEFVIVMFGKGA